MIHVGDSTIFDRMEFYADNAEVFEQARQRFSALIQWLNSHNMLSEEGIEVAHKPIPDDLSLSDRLLNSRGIKFLTRHYETWLLGDGTTDPVSTQSLDEALLKQE